MGARLVVRFGQEENPPRVYLHHGGEYSKDVKDTLYAFVAAVSQLEDRRASDPEYLAAKLLVWAANTDKREPHKALNFLSVGVVTSDGWGDAVAEFPCIDNSLSFAVLSALDIPDKVR